MSRPPGIKLRSEEKRERDVLQYVAAYQDLPRLEEFVEGSEISHLPPDYNAQRSTDSTLIALCQLAALRLNAQRALISLIDGQRQHVLAEATPRTSLRSSHPKGDGINELWLGSVSIPRSWGVCEQVLGLDLATADVPVGEGSSVIVNEDLLHSGQHAHRTYVKDGTIRFYTGAALVGPNGAVVGALCVFDDQPRPGGIPAEDVTYLEDLAATIIEYLGTYTVKDKFRRGEKLTRGLISFAEGASALLPLDQIASPDRPIPYAPTATTPSSLASSVGTVPLHDTHVQSHQFPSAETNNATLQTSQPGSLGLFGNALKYTHTGHVTVSLHAANTMKSTGPATTVTLTVSDTGAGMSPSFLANKAFQPFSQENPHSPGVGLGLSIVRQIIEANGGKIEVSSDHSTGTKVTVKLSMARSEVHPSTMARRAEYLSCLSRLQGRKVCILHRSVTDQDIRDEPRNAEGLAKFTRALTSTLSNHLKMRVSQSTKWHDNDTELIICPEPSFDYLASIRDRRAVANADKAPVTIFVALDALEAATLRSDVRVQSKESVVEIMNQPLGSFKLACVLDKCLERYERPEENAPRSITTPIVGGLQVGSPASDQSTPYSPAPAEMPPLLNQPFWHQTDKLDAAAASEGLMISRPPLKSPTVKKLTLPVNSKVVSPGATMREPSKILITDDNVINRKLLVAFMKRNNLDYMEAENGLEALRTYQSNPAHFDVILMDMSMPVMDGVSATRAIRQYEQEYNIPRCYIMALTGLASASAKLEAWNAGIDNFMTKPVNFKALGKSLLKAKGKRENSEDTTGAEEPLPNLAQSES
ncbi:hypothetical protein G6514_006963 [Epicoccum nigrum]|nr:hypothetical protein G6514_006963 [Epicoccum nigrum]